MTSIYDYLDRNRKIYDNWDYSNKSHLRVADIWENRDSLTTRYSCEFRNAELSDLKIGSWTDEPPSAHDPQSSSAKILEIVLVTRLVQSQVFDVTQDLFRSVHERAGHSHARKVSQSVLAGIGVTKSTSRSQEAYYLTFHPKFSMTWSRSLGTGRTTVICIAEEPKLQKVEDLLRQEFLHPLITHFMVPAVLAAIIFSVEVDNAQEAVKEELRKVEVRTGHHQWRSRAEPPALGDLVSLAAKMSGCGTRISSCIRKQHAICEIQDFIGRFCKRSSKTADVSQCSSLDNSAVREVTATLSARTKSQQMDSSFIKHRVQTQLDALYHLVAQNDALVAQEMAQDCRLLAAASLRDSASMKCIAVVTMFFLPGTFISSLLSIPLFDWDADSSDDRYRARYAMPVLKTFLAMTLPLMAITFGTWGFWVLLQKIQNRRKAALAMLHLNHHQRPQDEVAILTLRKRCLPESSK